MILLNPSSLTTSAKIAWGPPTLAGERPLVSHFQQDLPRRWTACGKGFPSPIITILETKLVAQDTRDCGSLPKAMSRVAQVETTPSRHRDGAMVHAVAYQGALHKGRLHTQWHHFDMVKAQATQSAAPLGLSVSYTCFRLRHRLTLPDFQSTRMPITVNPRSRFSRASYRGKRVEIVCVLLARLHA